MGQVKVNRNYQLTKIEESWLNGELDGAPLDVHVIIYRCEAGEWANQIGAQAHIHKLGGGHLLKSSGAPDVKKLHWAPTRNEAVSDALNSLEAKLDLVAN